MKYGDELTVEPVAVAGYNVEVSPAGPITVAGDVNVKVSYTAKEYTLTVAVEGNLNDGGATVTVGGAALTLSEGAKGTATVKYGDELTVEPVAVAGYNAVVSPTSPITVAGDVNVKVSYTSKEYTLTVAVEGNPNNGGATVTVGGAALTLSEGAKGTATVKYGDELTVEPVAVAGYNVEVSPTGPITVADDVNVKVSYTAKETAVESVLLSAATLTPNPASVVVRLSNAEAAKSYAVYTLRGAEVMRGVLAGESVVAIDVTLLADGVYLLRVEAADGARVLRFVVAR